MLRDVLVIGLDGLSILLQPSLPLPLLDVDLLEDLDSLEGFGHEADRRTVVARDDDVLARGRLLDQLAEMLFRFLAADLDHGKRIPLLITLRDCWSTSLQVAGRSVWRLRLPAGSPPPR